MWSRQKHLRGNGGLRVFGGFDGVLGFRVLRFFLGFLGVFGFRVFKVCWDFFGGGFRI